MSVILQNTNHAILLQVKLFYSFDKVHCLHNVLNYSKGNRNGKFDLNEQLFFIFGKE